MNHFPEFILASSSPRRADLLRQTGFKFRVAIREVDERSAVPAEPEAHVREVSQRKAKAIMTDFPNRLIVAADTIVAIDTAILGKPDSVAAARQMLQQLSGRQHTVYTGVTLANAGQMHTETEQTEVCFRTLSPMDIDWYIETGEPFDKAGAYGIQGFGALLVERISGCYFNVVGLPLTRFQRMMCEAASI